MTRLSTSGSTSSCEYLHPLHRFVTRLRPTDRVPNDSLLQRRHFRNGGSSNIPPFRRGRVSETTLGRGTALSYAKRNLWDSILRVVYILNGRFLPMREGRM